ncbi:MAG: TIM barrel protein, partial [Cohnella sp.]|nr:TIM barrel protein [Cohnella sp.]
ALLFYHAVGRLARTIGVHVNVHPHSHHGSLLETAESYRYLMERLDAEIALGPDSGHIVRGGQDLVQCVRKYAERIGHIHFKDVRDRAWTPVGEGSCDFAGVVRALREAGYGGWIIAEEESTWTLEGRTDILRANREYIEHLLEA